MLIKIAQIASEWLPFLYTENLINFSTTSKIHFKYILKDCLKFVRRKEKAFCNQIPFKAHPSAL